MNLYRLTTLGLGDYWVVASDPTTAETLLLSTLNKADYGFRNSREVLIITKIASANQDYRFISDKKLILPE